MLALVHIVWRSSRSPQQREAISPPPKRKSNEESVTVPNEATTTNVTSGSPLQEITISEETAIPTPAFSPSTHKFSIVCPKCKTQNFYDVTATRSNYTFQCPKCKKVFQSLIVLIKAKRSQGNKKEGKRSFSVRVVEGTGAERLIEFTNSSYEDFELRAKDLAVFTYLGNDLKIVQNKNIGRYWTVSRSDCFIATYLYGPNSEEVALLRRYRDDVLVRSTLLSPLISIYYRVSPLTVRLLGKSRLFKTLCFELMKPVIRYVRGREINDT